MVTISKFFININVQIITYIKKVLRKIGLLVLLPIKTILKIIQKICFKPFLFIFINISKNFKKLLPKNEKILNFYNNSAKKSVNRKDF